MMATGAGDDSQAASTSSDANTRVSIAYDSTSRTADIYQPNAAQARVSDTVTWTNMTQQHTRSHQVQTDGQMATLSPG